MGSFYSQPTPETSSTLIQTYALDFFGEKSKVQNWAYPLQYKICYEIHLTGVSKFQSF